MIKISNSNINSLFTIIVLVTISRISIPHLFQHPMNFSAIDATALMCGAYFSRKGFAIATVLASVWVGDLFINKILTGNWILFYSGFYWQYASYILITFIGFALKNKINTRFILFTSLSASTLFFTISNFGVWISSGLYPPTPTGLIESYIAAIPFFKNTVLSDLFFSILLFVIMEKTQLTYPKPSYLL